MHQPRPGGQDATAITCSSIDHRGEHLDEIEAVLQARG
jgi:hypothetical protein